MLFNFCAETGENIFLQCSLTTALLSSEAVAGIFCHTLRFRPYKRGANKYSFSKKIIVFAQRLFIF